MDLLLEDGEEEEKKLLTKEMNKKKRKPSRRLWFMVPSELSCITTIWNFFTTFVGLKKVQRTTTPIIIKETTRVIIDLSIEMFKNHKDDKQWDRIG